MGQNVRVSDLIDTTEMYLRTIYELVEEGIVPLRARIAERLHQSGPTVSQTVARMERDGLLTVEGDRHAPACALPFSVRVRSRAWPILAATQRGSRCSPAVRFVSWPWA